ncbi:hypothetical protein AB2B38_004255 [Balneola sp. MJW-20]|uniref:hypothetical protein n=1 Tax=Gracilimonas aurantiaca TaxID=3234185 RepID=UPI003466AC30
MLSRLARIAQSLVGAAGVAAFPLKTLGAIVGTVILPYLMYAFLGGFGLALALVAIVWGIIWLAKKDS